MISFFIPGPPVAFARAGSNGKRRFTPDKQRSYMESIAWAASEAHRSGILLQGPLRMNVRAVWSVPVSYTRKCRENLKWKTTRADLDNCIKIVADALNGVIYYDDAQICEVLAQKQFGPRPGVTVTIEALGVELPEARA